MVPDQPHDEVFWKTNDLLVGASAVSEEEVRHGLGWPAERQPEVTTLLAQLVDDGYLQGRPERGDNQLLGMMILGVTPLGRQRLAEIRRPWWRQAWRRGGRPSALWLLAFATTVAGGVIIGVIVYDITH
jgi:hypothetical protein